MLADLDKQLQYGPGMRAQLGVDGALLLATFFTGDLRFACVTLGLTALQALSPRLVPVALAVCVFVRTPTEHRLGDLYFDLRATRGAAWVATPVMAAGIWLLRSGHDLLGYAILTAPTASILLGPTVGFCCGCAVYVGMREVLARIGFAKRYAHGACDIDIDGSKAPARQ